MQWMESQGMSQGFSRVTYVAMLPVATEFRWERVM